MRRPFNNREVTHMMARFIRHPHSHKLRADIMLKAYPLIDAAMATKLHHKNSYRLKDDIRQECALKVMQALPKFDPRKGAAFPFLWTTICNMINTQNKRLSKGGLSIEEEPVLKEVELAAPISVPSPEQSYVVRVISIVTNNAIASPEFRAILRSKNQKAVAAIKQAVYSGELFSERDLVVKRLKKLGVSSKDGNFLANLVIVNLRAKLYNNRELLYSLAHKQLSVPTSVSEESLN